MQPSGAPELSMFSRRPYQRHNRGRVSGGAPQAPGPTQPSSGFGYWDVLNATDDGSGKASVLVDAVGANSITQAVVSSRATISAAAGPGGGPALSFDGGDYYVKAYSRNQPTSRICLAKFTVPTTTLFDGATLNTGRLYGATTSVATYAGTAGPTGATTLTDWHVYRVDFNATNTQLFIDGVLKATGNAGVANPGGITIGAAGPGSANQLVGLICFQVECDIADAADWDLYGGTLHGFY